jgi:hypothetical protein
VSLVALTPEQIAEQFHNTYERLAPKFGYVTRIESRTGWQNVPDENKALMIATVKSLIARGVIKP